MADLLLEEPFSTVPTVPTGHRHDQSAMKWLSCIVRPESLDAVKEALSQLPVGGMTITDVRGFGRQKGQVEHYRGGEYTVRFLPKIRIDIAVQAQDVDQVVTAISKAGRTGQVGDGKIFVCDLHDVMRIRTGEKGTIAL